MPMLIFYEDCGADFEGWSEDTGCAIAVKNGKMKALYYASSAENIIH